VTAAQAATALSVSEATIRRWAAAGVIASRRWGRTLRIPVEALGAASE
jgi:excisionase family DNA binding protein